MQSMTSCLMLHNTILEDEFNSCPTFFCPKALVQENADTVAGCQVTGMLLFLHTLQNLVRSHFCN